MHDMWFMMIWKPFTNSCISSLLVNMISRLRSLNTSDILFDIRASLSFVARLSCRLPRLPEVLLSGSSPAHTATKVAREQLRTSRGGGKLCILLPLFPVHPQTALHHITELCVGL